MREFEIIEQHMKRQRHNGRPLHNRRFRLTEKDRQLVRKQLKIFTLEDLLDAVTQTHRTDWNLGGNPIGKKYLDLRLCIDDDHIQKRLEDFEKHEIDMERIADREAMEAEKELIVPEPSTITDTKAAYREALRGKE